MSQQSQIAIKFLSVILNFCSDSVQTGTRARSHFSVAGLQCNWMINFIYTLIDNLSLFVLMLSSPSSLTVVRLVFYSLSWPQFCSNYGSRPHCQSTTWYLYQFVSSKSGFSSVPCDSIRGFEILQCLTWFSMVNTWALLTTLIHSFNSIAWEDDIWTKTCRKEGSELSRDVREGLWRGRNSKNHNSEIWGVGSRYHIMQGLLEHFKDLG